MTLNNNFEFPTRPQKFVKLKLKKDSYVIHLSNLKRIMYLIIKNSQHITRIFNFKWVVIDSVLLNQVLNKLFSVSNLPENSSELKGY